MRNKIWNCRHDVLPGPSYPPPQALVIISHFLLDKQNLAFGSTPLTLPFSTQNQAECCSGPPAHFTVKSYEMHHLSEPARGRKQY